MEKNTCDPSIEAAVRESIPAQEVDSSSQRWLWGGLLFMGVVWFCILFNATIDPVIFWLASGAMRKIQLAACGLLIVASITRLQRRGGSN